MTPDTIAEYIGWLFLAYSTGFGSGLLITTFRKLADKI